VTTDADILFKSMMLQIKARYGRVHNSESDRILEQMKRRRNKKVLEKFP
jgi:hypothetical protein